MALQGSEETGLGSIPTAAGADSPGQTPPAGIADITSVDASIVVRHPTGPTTDLAVAAAAKFPGFGTSPPLVSSTSSAGVATTAARSDHTHGSTVADWGTLGSLRYFACDGVLGSDANAGYSDVSQAAAGLVAVKTLAKLLQIVPKIGAGRKARIAIQAANYASDTTFAASGFSGYANIMFIGTDTVASAGAVAFAGDTNDVICAGMTTATGMNAAGYNPTAYSVAADGTPTITLQLAGGGAPGFPAAPARPYGCRLRFDVATTTAGLRNKAFSILLATGGNLLTIGLPLGTNPVFGNAGDVCYIEMPNVKGPTLTLINNSGGAGAALRIAGMALGLTEIDGGAVTLGGCEDTGKIINECLYNALGTVSNLPSGSAVVGTSVRSGGTTVNGGTFTVFDSAELGTLATKLQESNLVQWERFAAPGIVLYGGTHVAGNNIGETVGTNSSTAHGAAAQIWAPVTSAQVQGIVTSGVALYGGYTLGRIKFSNIGAHPCVAFGGVGLGSGIQGISGGVADGNLDVGLDLSPAGISGNSIGAVACALGLFSATATGSNGDVRLSTGQIVSWASLLASGLTDSNGNRIVSAIGPTTITKFSGFVLGAVGAALSYLSDQGPSGAANQTTPLRYPTSIRLATRLRVTVSQDTSVNAVTVTLYKNGVATTMTVSIPAGTAANTKFLDAAHPILFLDGDDYDLRMDDPAGDGGGSVNISAGLEWAA